MPNSLIKDALASDGAAGVPPQQPATTVTDGNQADDEIRKIADQVSVCIKIIRCGGGESNTINRCVAEGISGAQLCAINTDAKHLLTIHVPTKILIGKTATRGMGAGGIP